MQKEEKKHANIIIRQYIKKQRNNFADKDLYSQSYCLSNSHVQIWELEHKDGWALKNLCFQTMLLKETWESLGQQGDQSSQS